MSERDRIDRDRDRDRDWRRMRLDQEESSYSADVRSNIIRIAPYYYIHILDQNTNVTSVEIGPKTYIRQDNEKVVYGPERMITIPPRNYCVIENPVQTDANGKVVLDENGQAKLKHADLDIRLAQDPFPLYPGEILKVPKTPLTIVHANAALRLRALLDFTTETEENVIAGDEWLFEGPGTFIPRKEVEVVETVCAAIIMPNQAIKLRARKGTTDREGNERVTGEEWVVEKTGAYLPGAYEEVVEIVDAHVLTEKKALHMRATRTLTDTSGKTRKNGEEWLICIADTETHIPNVYEKVLNVIDITTLNNRQYCVICDPVGTDGKPQLGQKRLVKGEKSFFLQPGEWLEKGIQNVHVLGEDEGLILRTTEEFMDGKAKRAPGDRWMIRGPCEYVPPVEVEVASFRKAIPLDANEGVYVRNIKTGQVRAVVGRTYMLNQDEELWRKELQPVVEGLLSSGKDPLTNRSVQIMQSSAQSGMQMPSVAMTTGARDKTKVVVFRVPHNAAVQIYDYKDKKARVMFGPDLVMLLPEEQFTVLSISGGKPKRPNVIKALCLLLGPDFCTDIVVVETADHARLSLQLSYNWHFTVEDKTTDGTKLFSVPDFIGDACKAIASRIRGAVASVKFDDFHKNSAKIIRSSVFGLDDKGKVRQKFTFPANSLNITSVDIQSVEPVDQRTRDALQKSVQLAIEITTASQEASAKHEAARLEQEARGRLERQKIQDEAEAEKARRELLELQALSAAVESTGQAKAEAQSRAEAARIEGEAAVQQSKLKANAKTIEAEANLTQLVAAREAEIKYVKEQNGMEVEKTRELSTIESDKFKSMVDSIGTGTIKAIANAGPDMQVKMLKSLGLQSTLITDGKSPINLFNTAEGLIGASSHRQSASRKRKLSTSSVEPDNDDE